MKNRINLTPEEKAKLRFTRKEKKDLKKMAKLFVKNLNRNVRNS